ncbi:antibiotic biosynthesis monooxygenase [Synergistaceae bacterium OttesenSCG-928-I11]|nr:antibiotic biosynthesis monooxygenase [Synergistaceae bacterium OttesenSCG-928-I11]
MIVVIARFEAKKGQRDKVVALAAPCIEATRKEAGCVSYELMLNTECAEALVFVERWESRAALDAHAKTAHLAAFKDARAPYVEGPSRLTLFEATELEG